MLSCDDCCCNEMIIQSHLSFIIRIMFTIKTYFWCQHCLFAVAAALLWLQPVPQSEHWRDPVGDQWHHRWEKGLDSIRFLWHLKIMLYRNKYSFSGSAGGVCPAQPSNDVNSRDGQNCWQWGDGDGGWHDGDIIVKCVTHPWLLQYMFENGRIVVFMRLGNNFAGKVL